MPSATDKDDVGAAQPLVPDPEGQYGATQPMLDKELPLLMGRFDVSPRKLLRIIVWTYVAFYAVFFLADLVYIMTVDARFPPGLEHLYPSDWERQQSVKYTRQTLACSMCRRTTVFLVVLAFIYFEIFAKADAWLRAFISSLVEKVYAWFGCCLVPLGRFLWMCCRPCRFCVEACCECCCAPLRRLFADHNWRELLHGSVYIALFATFFFLLSAPFMYWRLTIELDFGFANALTVTTDGYKQKLVSDVIGLLIWGIPGKFLFLAVLKFRLGWLFMWACMMVAIIFAQYNFSWFAPIVMGMNNPFPNEAFAVGRGLPIVRSNQKSSPYISLNRIFYKDSDGNPATRQFSTNDLSPGPLVLRYDDKLSSWLISAQPYYPGAPTPVYAKTHATANKLLQNLGQQTWNVGDLSGRIGLRSGNELRDKVFGFANERNIKILEIYMIDGSHKDARANAFVGGIDGSIIGLYDTLFLGEHSSDTGYGESLSFMQRLYDKDGAIQLVSESLQEVDVVPDYSKERWTSAPTQAMTDDEIISILAHELAHPALWHMEQTMFMQSSTSFATFAVLGWAAHSPLLAFALALTAPMLHVGACFYDHVIGPSVNTFLKFFTDALTRHNEYQADAYVAYMSERYGKALQTSLVKLAVNTNQDPDIPYWYEALYTDHPSAAHRWAHLEEALKETHA